MGPTGSRAPGIRTGASRGRLAAAEEWGRRRSTPAEPPTNAGRSGSPGLPPHASVPARSARVALLSAAPRAPLNPARVDARPGAYARVRASIQSPIASILTRSCFIESRSRIVTVPPVIVSPSTVAQKGVPTSSCRR